MIGWIQTYSTRAVTPYNLTPDQVCVEDIAHHLSLICRWSGACEGHYSVAQHSIAVAELVPERLRLAALLHDASEAYLGDVASPIKKLPQMAFYREAEERAQRAIFQALKVPHVSRDDWAIIHAADQQMLSNEAFLLLPNLHPDFILPVAPSEGCSIKVWSPEMAEVFFLQKFEEYRRAC